MPEQSKKQLQFLVKVAYIGVIGLLVYICYKYLLSLVLPFVLALLIVTLVNPLIRRLTKRLKLKRSVVSFCVMLLLYLLLGALLFLGIMTLIVNVKDQLVAFSKNYFDDFLQPAMNSLWNGVSDFIIQLPESWQSQIGIVQTNLMSSAQKILGDVSGKLLNEITRFTTNIPGFLIAFIFTIMLSFFISVRYEEVVGFLKNQLPQKATEVITDLRAILGKTVFLYLRAVLTLMVITGIEVTIGLTILKVEHALLIGIGIAIFDALPVFGTGAIMVPWIIIELIQGNMERGIGLMILYAFVSVVRSIIEPKVVGDRLGINPIVSMVAIYFGFKVFGVFGMIFMPMAAQILLEFHKRGTITLFRSPEPALVVGPDPVASPQGEGETKEDKTEPP